MEWISVKERLPERDGRYLVAGWHGWISEVDSKPCWMWWTTTSTFKSGEFFIEAVEYWMELPLQLRCPPLPDGVTREEARIYDD